MICTSSTCWASCPVACGHRGPPYAGFRSCARRSPDETSFGACGQADIEQTAYFWRRTCAALWHKGRSSALVFGQVVADRVGGRVGFAAGAYLAVDIRDVPGHGTQAEHKLAGYLKIGASGGDQAQDLDFASCQLARISRLRARGRFPDIGGAGRLHRPDAHCIRDSLQPLVATVLERHTSRSPRQRAYRLGHQHLARRRQPANARGDVHSATVDIALLTDDIPGVEAEVQGEAAVSAGAGAGKRRFDRLSGAREYGEDAVAKELPFDRRART